MSFTPAETNELGQEVMTAYADLAAANVGRNVELDTIAERYLTIERLTTESYHGATAEQREALGGIVLNAFFDKQAQLERRLLAEQKVVDLLQGLEKHEVHATYLGSGTNSPISLVRHGVDSGRMPDAVGNLSPFSSCNAKWGILTIEANHFSRVRGISRYNITLNDPERPVSLYIANS